MFVKNLRSLMDKGWMFIGSKGDGNCGVYTAFIIARLLGGPSWGFPDEQIGRCHVSMARAIRSIFLKN